MSAGGPALYAAGMRPDTDDPSECRFCHWWTDPVDPSNSRMQRIPNYRYECRRLSPVTDSAHDRGRPIWPKVLGKDRCGDFERFRNADGTPNRETA